MSARILITKRDDARTEIFKKEFSPEATIAICVKIGAKFLISNDDIPYAVMRDAFRNGYCIDLDTKVEPSHHWVQRPYNYEYTEDLTGILACTPEVWPDCDDDCNSFYCSARGPIPEEPKRTMPPPPAISPLPSGMPALRSILPRSPTVNYPSVSGYQPATATSPFAARRASSGRIMPPPPPSSFPRLSTGRDPMRGGRTQENPIEVKRPHSWTAVSSARTPVTGSPEKPVPPLFPWLAADRPVSAEQTVPRRILPSQGWVMQRRELTPEEPVVSEKLPAPAQILHSQPLVLSPREPTPEEPAIPENPTAPEQLVSPQLVLKKPATQAPATQGPKKPKGRGSDKDPPPYKVHIFRLPGTRNTGNK